MSLRIVRNDITRMDVDAIVNTANEQPIVGAGCDYAVYTAAGFDTLLKKRTEIGYVPEGEVFLTPGYKLPARHIIHAVSPLYQSGESGEEEKLRSCYRKSLELARDQGFTSVAFPLISTGSFGYPREEGMLIAVSEISAFLLKNEMLVYLVVFEEEMTALGNKLYPDLQSYIDTHYVEEKLQAEYRKDVYSGNLPHPMASMSEVPPERRSRRSSAGSAMPFSELLFGKNAARRGAESKEEAAAPAPEAVHAGEAAFADTADFYGDGYLSEEHEKKLEERVSHLSDTFSEYLLFLIEQKGLTNADVYKKALVDKKVFSKIKNNTDYHPTKLTAMSLCVGARLNLDETKDLLARAGYALSPCDMRDVIFSYFITYGLYDMVNLDVELERFGIPPIIG